MKYIFWFHDRAMVKDNVYGIKYKDTVEISILSKI